MNRWRRGLLVGAMQVALLASLGAKLLVDRETMPRVWIATAPADPDLPVRGRYVRLLLVVEPRGPVEGPALDRAAPPTRVVLRVDGDKLIAVVEPQPGRAPGSELGLRFISRHGERVAALDRPVAYFIPETAADPSARAADETLYVEATVPPTGLPRPIRLGVRKGDAPIVPLELH